jgi:hypothetical protein
VGVLDREEPLISRGHRLCHVRIGRNVAEFKDCRSQLVPCAVENDYSCTKRSPIIGRFPSGPSQQVIEIPTNAKAEVRHCGGAMSRCLPPGFRLSRRLRDA